MAGILFYHDLGQDKRGFPTVVMIHGDSATARGHGAIRRLQPR